MMWVGRSRRRLDSQSSIGGTAAGWYDGDMKLTVGPFRRDAEHRTTLFYLRLATVIVGIVAVGATFELFFGNVDICGESPGWWIGALFISPLVFVGLCSWCATIAVNEVEKSTWATLGGLLALLYIYAAAGTLMSGELGTLWC